MTETKRIRWEPTGHVGWTGHVGTLADWPFQIWDAASVGGGWQLDSSLPGHWRRTGTTSTDPDELKAEAERWLEEFVTSLGAVFPAGPGEIREALRSLRCVQAGWAFGVPEDGREQWLDLVAEEVRDA